MVLDFEQILQDNLEDIISLLSIPSVYDEDSIKEGQPYGEYVHKAFVFMKDKALADGFAVSEYDGHALAVQFGKGPHRIDIPCHLDVVAADEDDFRIRIKEGKLIGRGTMDMKVPMYLCYLSLKLLKEKYPDMSKMIRLVLGGDEERTMNDLKYYISQAGFPDFAFTPDGSFPMGIGEKGAIMWELKGHYDGIITSLRSGSQCNIVENKSNNDWSCIVFVISIFFILMYS